MASVSMKFLARASALIGSTDSEFRSSTPEGAAFGGAYDIKNYYTPPWAFPWWALNLYVLFQFCFLAYYGYVYVIYRRRRTVTHAKKIDNEELAADEFRDLREGLYVMCGSLEHSLPHLRKGKATAGGLGKVMHIVGRTHPTRLTMVHPMLKQGPNLNYENHEEVDPLKVMVDGVYEHVRVFYQQGPRAGGPDGPEVDFLLLSHPLFEQRDPANDIYPEPMTRVETLRFYSLWNQCYAALIVRHKPMVLHMPDFHSCIAPWYAAKELPSLKIVLMSHNAEYQGDVTTDMLHDSTKLKRIAAIFNLPVSVTKKHLVFEGRFNMLKAGVDFIMEKQGGRGVHAVSTHYAQEINSRYSMLWRLRVKGLDNPMLEEERPDFNEPLEIKKSAAKLEVQKLLGLNEDPHARLFVSLGRLVRMKGVDIIADVVPWLLRTYPNAQLAVIGPVADGYGVYCREKLYAIKDNEEFKGRLFVRCEWMNVPPAIKFGADYCIMPSRDEPFGYVDIEFAWHGAVMVGAEAGGLGKVPGFYFIAQNRENYPRMRQELRNVLSQAMECPAEQLQAMSQEALDCKFPLVAWQRKLLAAYQEVLPANALSQGAVSCPGSLGTWLLDSQDQENKSYPAAIVDTFKPFAARERRPQNFVDALVQAPSMLTAWMEGQPPMIRPTASVASHDEFLTQELSTDELAGRVKTKLASYPDMTMETLVESIGADVNFEREADGSNEQRMLIPTCGVMRVHLCVVMGYLVAPLADVFTNVVCTEWALRVPLAFSPSHTPGVPALKFDSVPSIFCIFLIVQCVAFMVGAPIWAKATMICQPRKVLGLNMMLQFLFFPIVMAITYNISCTSHSSYNGHDTGCTAVSGGGVYAAIILVFLKALVSSGALLFLCFSFMLSLKTDISFAAIRMGVIEMIRYCLTFLPVLYVLLVSPTNLVGTKDHPVSPAVVWALLPIVVIIAATALVPGVLLFLYAPGPYRDDRFPGWEIRLLFKRKSFLLFAISDCLGAIALFPSITYIWWWFAATESMEVVNWFLLLFTIVFCVGFAAWAKALSGFSKQGLQFLAGAAVLIGPPGIIRAVAMQEVSQPVSSGSIPHFAIFISGMSLLLEGIRSTAQWTAKIKVLDSRWRLLSFGTANIAALSFWGLLSPVLTWGIAMKNNLWIGSAQPKPLADWAMMTLVPIGILQFIVQLCASPFIFRDLGANVVPIKQRQNACLRILTAPALLVFIIFIGLYLDIVPALRLMDAPVEFSPTRRCDGQWTDSDFTKLKEYCKIVDSSTKGGAFNRNANHQITLARYNCLQHMKLSGGNAFLLEKKDAGDNVCTVLKCDLSPLAVADPAPTIPFQNTDAFPLEVWSQRCSGYSPNKRVGVQLMEWNWYDIGEECEHHLGPAGVDYVHVSPPAEHVLGNLAYTKYQPVSFELDSRSGSTQEFRQMVRKCRENNVSIMVDFIVNHLASSFPTPEAAEIIPREVHDDSLPQCGVNVKCEGWAGSHFGSRVYKCKNWNSDESECAIKRSAFHHTIGNDKAPACSFSMDNMAINFFSGVDQCDPGFGVDLNTEYLDTVRMIQKYLLSLTDAGVTMLRVDAAMLVGSKSLARILEPFPWEFLTQEDLGWTKSQGAMHDFPFRFEISTVYDWSWGPMLGTTGYLLAMDPESKLPIAPPKFTDLVSYRPSGPQNLSVLDEGVDWANEISPQSENVLVYVDNHDGMSKPLDYHLGNTYISAILFMLFHPWGSAAQVMSSFWHPAGGSITHFPPPLKNLTAEEQFNLSQGDWKINLTRKVNNVSCRIAPKTIDTSLDAEWMAGKCADGIGPNGNGFGCDWICQHRWPGVAALSRARHYVGKGMMVKQQSVWTHPDNSCLAFNVGAITWMFMQHYLSPERNLTDLLQHDPKPTMMHGGKYCNIAQLPQKYVKDLQRWEGSDGQKYCMDASSKLLIAIDMQGRVESGIVPAGELNGIVVIHEAFKA